MPDRTPPKLRALPPNMTVRAEQRDGEKTVVLTIYDVIGRDWLTGEGTTARDIRDALQDHDDAARILLHLNSPGGDVFDGQAIYTQLHRHPAHVTVHIDGLAASAASYIAMAGDEISIAENAFVMIHEPSGLAFGTAEDMIDYAAMLEKICGSMVQLYAARTGQSAETLRQMLRKDTYLTAHEAVELGFATSLFPAKQAAANCRGLHLLAARRDLPPALAAIARRNHPPEPEEQSMTTPTPPAPSDADVQARIETSLQAERARIRAIQNTLTGEPLAAVRDQAIQDGLSEEQAKAAAFEAQTGHVKALQTQIADLQARLDAVAEAGDDAPAPTPADAEEPSDAPAGDQPRAEAYQAEVDKQIAAGKSAGQAHVEASKRLPRAKEAWLETMRRNRH